MYLVLRVINSRNALYFETIQMGKGDKKHHASTNQGPQENHDHCKLGHARHQEMKGRTAISSFRRASLIYGFDKKFLCIYCAWLKL